MRIKPITLFSLLALIATTSCHELFDLVDLHPQPPRVSEYASGLTNPFGVEVDAQGWVWVAEGGSGNNDSRLSVVTSKGKVYPVIEGFASVIPPQEPTPVGISHFVINGTTLWILNTVEQRLYWADLASWQPGDAPLRASDLKSEDIGTFVRNYEFDQDTGESNPYNLTLGPDGDLYIADAAANAIIKREAHSGALSVFATLPSIENPAEVGPPVIDAVPTGIVWDGQQFLVSTLTGFPFPEGEALIYAIDRNGQVSVDQKGFTSLVDISLSADGKPVVVQYAGPGFAPESGRVVYTNGGQSPVVLDKLNYPLGIARRGLKTYYVTQSASGSVQKVVF